MYWVDMKDFFIIIIKTKRQKEDKTVSSCACVCNSVDFTDIDLKICKHTPSATHWA